MDISEISTFVLVSNIFQLPILITWLVAVILSIVFRNRHPKVSLVALIGFSIFFLQWVISLIQNVWIQTRLMSGDYSVSELGLINAGVGILIALLSLGAWILVLFAIFGWRSPGAQEMPQRYPGDVSHLQ